MATPANLALEAVDPRIAPDAVGGSNIELSMLHAIHDRSVTFEEYVHYAYITRAEEKADHEEYTRLRGPRTLKSTIIDRFASGNKHTPAESPPHHSLTHTGDGERTTFGDGEKTRMHANGNGAGVTPAEWKRASRALRTAGWGGIFYLITTDILGPFSVPYVILSFSDL